MASDMSRFQDLALQESSEVVVLLNVDGVVVWVSPSAVAVTGFDPEELLGGSVWRSVVHPDDLERLLAAPELRLVRVRLMHKSRGYRTAEVRYRPLHEDPDDLFAIVTVRDVTDESLVTSEYYDHDELDRFIGLTDDAVVLSAGQQVVWASPATERLLAVGPGKVVRLGLDDVVHPDDVAVVEGIRSMLMTGQPAVGRVRVRDSEGTYHAVEMQVVQLGDPADAHGFRISRMRLLEESEPGPAEAMRTYDRRDVDDHRPPDPDPYRTALDNVADPITITESGVVVWASRQFGELVGEDPNELIGRNLLGDIHPDDVETIRAVRASVPDDATRSDPLFATVRIRDHAGSWRWAELHISPLLGGAGVPVRAVVSWRLVDRQVERVEALTRSEAHSRELADQLQGALKSRVLIEQAKGMLAAQRDIGVEEAFGVLRSHARSRGVKLVEVARAVVELGLRL